MNENIKVRLCETFESIQGEQQGVGLNCLFVRLYGCNLGPKCPLNCDTKHSWDSKLGEYIEIPLYSLMIIVDASISEGKIKNVVITGGEPLLQMVVIEALTKAFNDITFFIETNGTLSPSQFLKNKNNAFFNVSPKTYDVDFNKLDFPINRSIFKFVVDSNVKDMAKFLTFYNTIPKDIQRKTYIMPHASNRKEYIKKSRFISEVCIKYGINFGPRIHISIWNGEKRK